MVAQDGALDKWRADLHDALRDACIPALLLVLAHVSRDLSCLDRYPLSRTRTMSENDDGGLSDEQRERLRGEALDALVRWRRDGSPRLPRLSEDRVVRMMKAAVGSDVPAEYGPMFTSELARLDGETIEPAGVDPSFHVVVIGSGLSGLCAAKMLQDAGISYEVLEKSDSVGGTWHDNVYPGCGVDTPSHLYSFSFAADYPWKKYFASRDELHAYTRHLADRFALGREIRLNTTVHGARFDVTSGRWQVEIEDAAGKRVRHADAVISAVGQLNRPKIPDIPGLTEFAGPWFHTAEWNADVDLRGKKVGVVGTGASAMQVVPRIAEVAGRLTVFQRSKIWFAGNQKYRTRITPRVSTLLNDVPSYLAWYRIYLSWSWGDSLHASVRKDPAWDDGGKSVNKINAAHRTTLSAHMERILDGRPDLIERVVPDYPPFGKRMLIDNGWCETLLRSNVELVTEPIEKITADGVVTGGGSAHDCDVIVFATGFEAQRLLAPMDIIGADGKSIRDVWGDDDPRAYLGITVPGFPNLFCLYGPGTNSAHGGSLLMTIEAQVAYIIRLISQLGGQGGKFVDCKAEPYEAYNQALDDAHAKMVWTHPGMRNWYRNAKGRVVTNTPWRQVDYLAMTRTPDLDDYTVG
ncbi:MAG TPA: NAD(P)/FAD-dependent oxidoreductase [Amycolatopsis sp.]|nr:NAD(P)/FAD-dependent oxidoreductase [Amycolatopsis sp.]